MELLIGAGIVLLFLMSRKNPNNVAAGPQTGMTTSPVQGLDVWGNSGDYNAPANPFNASQTQTQAPGAQGTPSGPTPAWLGDMPTPPSTSGGCPGCRGGSCASCPGMTTAPVRTSPVSTAIPVRGTIARPVSTLRPVSTRLPVRAPVRAPAPTMQRPLPRFFQVALGRNTL